MSKWLPIITNDGIMYFFDKSTGTCQWTYPKIHNPKQNKYLNVFFQDWTKVKYGDKVYYMNKKTSEKQDIKPWSTTYIFEACYLDNFAFVELYLEYNGNVNLIERHGKNCLHYAVMNDNDIMAKMLIGLGCDVNHKDNKGQTPLVYCVNYRSYKCIKVLIEDEHCDINAIDMKMNSVMHYAVKTRNHKLILFLVNNGARIDMKNKKGEYPVDVALKDNNWPIVNMITKLSNIERVKRELEENNEDIFQEEMLYDLFQRGKSNKVKGLEIKNFNKLKRLGNWKVKGRGNIDNDRYYNTNKTDNNNQISLSNSKTYKRNNDYDYNNEYDNNHITYNSNNSNSQRLSIDEVNFSRDTIRNLKENKLKIKDSISNYYKPNKSLYIIDEEDYNTKQQPNSKRERIKQYKSMNTSRLSTQSTLSSLTNSFVSAMKDYVYPSMSSIVSIGYTNMKYLLSKIYSASVKFTKENGVRAYHYISVFIQNAKIYFKSPPDIENQIEYLTYLEDDQNQLHNRDKERDNNKLYYNKDKDKGVEYDQYQSNKLSSFNKFFNQSLSYLSIEELQRSSEYDRLRKKRIDSNNKVNYTIKKSKRSYRDNHNRKRNRQRKVYVINSMELYDRKNKFSIIKYYAFISKLSFDTEFIKLLNKQPLIIEGKSNQIKHWSKPILKIDKTATKEDHLLFIDLIDTDINNNNNNNNIRQSIVPLYSNDIIKYQISKIQGENALKVPHNSIECSLKLNFNNLNEKEGVSNANTNIIVNNNNNNRYDIQPLSNRSYGKCYDNIVKSIQNINFILDNTNLKARPKTDSLRYPKKNYNDNNKDLMVLIEDEKWDNLDLSENISLRNQRDSFEDDDDDNHIENENDIDIEDILTEYNNKLKDLKSRKSSRDNGGGNEKKNDDNGNEENREEG